MSQDNEILVKVEGVSKKFCRDLKKSLWYGVKDVASELLPFGRKGSGIRNQEAEITNSSSSISNLQSPISFPSLRPGEFWANKDISFELRRGECLGLIGGNGAGKTTLLKMLNGLIKPDSGTIEMRGRVGALIALGAGFNPILTGRENIYVNGAVIGLTKREIEAKMEEIIDFAEIGDFIDAPVQSYSSGMTVRLGFAIAAKTEPDILLLDEVLAVGDVGFQAKCFNTIAGFRERGTAFILVAHNMHQIARYSDHVLYLNRGQTVHLGNLEEGISKYLTDMREKSEGIEQRTDWSRVYGSGKIFFKAARFMDYDAKQVTKIPVGQPVIFELDYQTQINNLKDIVIDLVLRDREEIVFQKVFQLDKYLLHRNSNEGNIRILFRAMCVNSDYVDFSFSALNTKTVEMYDWKRDLRLEIERSKSQTGKILLEAELV